MRLNVTPIGSGRLSAGQVAKAVVEYLAGAAKEIPAPGVTDPPSTQLTPPELGDATAYYADSVEGPGRWLGRGAHLLGLSGTVGHDAFARVLEGRHPDTGERLLSARGSADRSHLAVGNASRRADDGSWLYELADAAKALGLPRTELEALVAEGDQHDVADDSPAAQWVRALRDDAGQRWVTDAELERFVARAENLDAARVLADGSPDDVLSLPEAARILGVGLRYLQGCARYWEEHRASVEALLDAGLRPQRAWLVATRPNGGKGHFKVSRDEVAAFVERRQRPIVRVGYDLTLSTEKSVAVLTMLSGVDRQRQLLDVIDRSNDVALRYLEDRAAVGRRQGRRVSSEGLVVASFLHATSRALDPFPHRHNVVANAIVDEFGERRALDGRALYRHAPAAAALATASMRWQLTTELGVRWTRSPRGVWEVDGVPEETIREFSQRRDEVDTALAELSEALGRPLGPSETDQVVLATRAAKARTPVEELRATWLRRARDSGFGRRALTSCFGRRTAVAPSRLDEERERELAVWLDFTVVAEAPTFSRGEVIEAICRWEVKGRLVVLPPEEVLRLADRYLASERVVELDGRNRRSRDTITRSDGTRVDATGGEPTFTTVAHARCEALVVHAFDDGIGADAAVVDARALEAVPGWDGLACEQQTFVRMLCTSGMAVQCAVGRPGSGKTHSLAAAARAWESTGHRVVGAAVKGEAARLLGNAAGIRAETLAWWLTAVDVGHERLDEKTVVIVDESSTIGTRDLDLLLDRARRAGAAVRLVGDPAQHGAVAAGGMFAALCRRRPSAVPVLRENRRQVTEVDRFVVDAVRAGRVAEALAALRQAGQLTEVRDADRLYAAMVGRWLESRHAGEGHPMIDRRNKTRRILNAVAHRVLQSEGAVAATGMTTNDGREFCVGDEVVARMPGRDLHPLGDRSAYVRNGSRGRVVRASTEGLVVDFEDLGRIEVPREFVEEHARPRGRPGIGLDHGYALTSYAVQGATLPASSSSVTAGARRRELYVNLTRGRRDNHLFVAAPSDMLGGEGHLPRPPEDDVVAEVLAAVGRPDEDRSALEVDPLALDVAEARAGRAVAELRVERERAVTLGDDHGARIASRAEQIAASAAARAAVAEPPPWVAALLPARPDAPWLGAKWDAAVGAVGAYRARWEPSPSPGGTPTGRVLGSPSSDEQRSEREQVLALVGDVWSGVVGRQLAAHARMDDSLTPGHRSVLVSPPPWLRRHLAELGASGAFSTGAPVRALAIFYGEVAALRERHGAPDASEKTRGPEALLGPRPDDALGRRQWLVLAERATRLSHGLSRSRAIAR